MKENLCLKCPDGVRGYCCFLNLPLGKYNIILENVPCPGLDLKTMKCKDFENRKRFNPNCMDDNTMFGKGGLPKGCLYLKGKKHLEPNPKVFIKDVIDEMTPQAIGLYNVFNNIKFEKFIPYLVK